MLRAICGVLLLGLSWHAPSLASKSGDACVRSFGGGVITCGGIYVIRGTPKGTSRSPSPRRAAAPPTTSRPQLALFLPAGLVWPCTGNALTAPQQGLALTIMLGTGRLPCAPAPPRPAPPGPPPGAIAVQFWKTIPLPVPRPTVPPGYGICGKDAYLVTNGTTHPDAYQYNTPLGLLTIKVTGTYSVDWGDPYSPGWSGPYSAEGEPWPSGQIAHAYDYVGYYTITVAESWSATWQLGGAGGVLDGLRTTAVIPRFRVEQLQAVITY